MTRLSFVHIAGNQLSGTLPDSLSGLTNLQVLDVSRNRCGVSRGGGEATAGTRVVLRLDDHTTRTCWCRLTGSLTGVANITGLVELTAYSNGFSGSLPNELSLLASCAYVSCGRICSFCTTCLVGFV